MNKDESYAPEQGFLNEAVSPYGIDPISIITDEGRSRLKVSPELASALSQFTTLVATEGEDEVRVPADNKAWNLFFASSESFFNHSINSSREITGYRGPDADEIAQKARLILIRRVIETKFYAHPFRWDQVSGFIFTSILNLTKDEGRKVAKASHRTVEMNITNSLETDDSQFITGPDEVFDEVNARINEETLKDAISKLPKKNQDTIVDIYYDGLSYREYADKYAINENTAKSRIRRGLGGLRNLITFDPRKEY